MCLDLPLPLSMNAARSFVHHRPVPPYLAHDEPGGDQKECYAEEDSKDQANDEARARTFGRGVGGGETRAADRRVGEGAGVMVG